MTHKVCGPDCAKELAMRERVRRERAESRRIKNEIREQREKLKTRVEHAREAQAAVNAYVRQRDAGLPCISCGNQNPVQWHAGHYLSRGAHPELALEPRNIFRQCSQCNDYLSGNQIEMRKGILARKGQAELDWLEGPHPPRKYTIEELKSIKAEYKQKLKDLQNRRET
jgi:hypothetical protein